MSEVQTPVTSAVENWLSNVRGAESGFFKAVHSAMLEARDKGNWNDLARLLCVVNGKKAKRVKVIEKERLPFAVPLKNIMEHVLNGVSFKYDPERDYGVKFSKKDNWGFDDDKILALDLLSVQKLTIRSEAYKKAFPKIEKAVGELSEEQKREKLQKDQDAMAKRFAKQLKDAGFDPDLIFGMARKELAD